MHLTTFNEQLVCIKTWECLPRSPTQTTLTFQYIKRLIKPTRIHV